MPQLTTPFLAAVCLCSWHVSRAKLLSIIEASSSFDQESIEFQDRVAYRTGLGDKTAVPPAVQTADGRNCGIEAARYEYGETCFATIREALEKTGIKPKQVNFVITNSSLCKYRTRLSHVLLVQYTARLPSL